MVWFGWVGLGLVRYGEVRQGKVKMNINKLKGGERK